jgi:hypothetical protein
MNAPMVGSWSVVIREVQPFTIHGDLYYEVQVLRIDDLTAPQGPPALFTLRVPQHAAPSVPEVGDRVAMTFLMGQVTSMKKI